MEDYLSHNGIQDSIAQKLQPFVVERFLARDIHAHGFVHERLTIIRYIPWVKTQYGIKRAIKLPFFSEGKPYRID